MLSRAILLYFFLLIFIPIYLSGDVSEKKLRFFNLDLHISVIADVKKIFESFGHEVVDWSISGHTWVFNKKPSRVDIVNQYTWYYLDQQMCEAFYERYKDFLEQFDGFIVTYNATFALLYQRLNKPIIIVNPTRYENPFTLYPHKWNWINYYLMEGVSSGKITIVSNNKGDQEYLKYYTNIDSTHIPSLCNYTQATYTGKQKGFISRTGCWQKMNNKLQIGLIQNNALSEPYTWQDLYDFQGIIHVPYQVSTMSIFEQYTANVPLFFPTKRFLKDLFFNCPESGAFAQLSFFQHFQVNLPEVPGDFNNLSDPAVIDRWIELADFYDEENMPYIIYFDSFQELEQLLINTNVQEVSLRMQKHNIQRKKMIYEKWEKVLENVDNYCQLLSRYVV